LLPRAWRGTLSGVRVTGVDIRRTLAAFALALVALAVSIGSSQLRRLRRERAREPAVAHAPAPVVVAPPPKSADEAAPVRPPLVLFAVNGRQRVVLVPQRDDGGFDAPDLRRAAIAFSQQSPGDVHQVAPRLLDLVYRSMRHFDGEVVRVISGYRRERASSRHSQGRAVDMTIDGIPNDRLAAYARDFGFVGVGLYPKRGFVHLDVRDASYFWIDDSAPDAPGRLVPVLEAQARSADAAARARGESPDQQVYAPTARRRRQR
jgi:hypothetical protein